MVRLSCVLVAHPGSPPPGPEVDVWGRLFDGVVIVADRGDWVREAQARGWPNVPSGWDAGLAWERGRAAVDDGWVLYAEAGEWPVERGLREWVESAEVEAATVSWVEADRERFDAEEVAGGAGRLGAVRPLVRLARCSVGFRAGPVPRPRSDLSVGAAPLWLVAPLMSGGTMMLEGERWLRAAVAAPGDAGTLAEAARRLRGLGQEDLADTVAERALRVARDSPEAARRAAEVARVLTCLDLGRVDVAARTIAEARAAGGQGGDLDVLEAMVRLRVDDEPGWSQAASLVERALAGARSGARPLSWSEEEITLILLAARLAVGDLDRAEVTWRGLSKPARRGIQARLARLEIEARRQSRDISGDIDRMGDRAGVDGWAIGAFGAERAGDVETAHRMLRRLDHGSGRMLPHRARLVALTQARLAADATLRTLDDGVSRSEQADPLRHAEVLADGGDLEGAHREIVESLRREPSDVDAWTALAAVLDRAGVPDGAMLAARAAVELEPRRSDLRLALGALCGRQGLIADAALHLRHCPPSQERDDWLVALGVEGRPLPGTPQVAVIVEDPGYPLLDRLAMFASHLGLEVLALGEVPPGHWPFQVRTFRRGNLGRAQAVEAARAGYLWFLHADARPASEDVLGRYNGSRDRVVIGQTWIAHRHVRDPLPRALAAWPNRPGPTWRRFHLDDLWMPREMARVHGGLDAGTFSERGAREWGLRLHRAGLPLVVAPGVMLDRPVSLDRWRVGIGESAREDVLIAMLHPGVPGTLDLGGWTSRTQEAFRTLIERGAPGLASAEEVLRGHGAISSSVLLAMADIEGRRAIVESFFGPTVQEDPRLGATTVVLVQRPGGGDPGAMAHTLSELRSQSPGPVEIVVVSEPGFDPGAEDIRFLTVGPASSWEERVNLGLAEARGATVLIVDDRARFPSGWRPRLLDHLRAWPDIGVVVVDGENEGVAPGTHAWPLAVPPVGLLVRRDVLELAGGLQPGLGSLSGVDLGIRARRLGFRVRSAGDVGLGLPPCSPPETWEEEVFRARWGLASDDLRGLRELAEGTEPWVAGPRMELRTGSPRLLVRADTPKIPAPRASAAEPLSEGTQIAEVC